MTSRILHLMLAATIVLSSSVPCGIRAQGEASMSPSAFSGETPEAVAHEHASASAHDMAEASGMPCHGTAPEPPPELTLPCLCGCGDAPGGSAALSRLPAATLLSALTPATPSRAPVPPLPGFEDAVGYFSLPDVVPWA